MHRFRTGATIRRIRLAAWVAIATAFLIPSSALLLVFSFVTHRHKLMLMGTSLLLLTILMIVLRWLITLRTHCPLCMAGIMAKSGCSKHRRAKTLFGSYRLRVALSVALTNRFTCPYCNEGAELKLRR